MTHYLTQMIFDAIGRYSQLFRHRFRVMCGSSPSIATILSWVVFLGSLLGRRRLWRTQKRQGDHQTDGFVVEKRFRTAVRISDQLTYILTQSNVTVKDLTLLFGAGYGQRDVLLMV